MVFYDYQSIYAIALFNTIQMFCNFKQKMTTQNPPERLIKFYDFNKYNCDALISNYLWASNPADFNDPFDCSVLTLDESFFTKEKMLQTTEKWSHDWWTDDELQNRDNYHNDYLRYCGIVCLNEFEVKNQDLLWGYYTHQMGFAVEFDQKILSENIKVQPVKINYRQPENFKKFCIDDDSIIEWIKQKKKIWENETEWRYVFKDLVVDPFTFLTKPETRIKKYNPQSIKTIYLGFKFFKRRNLVKIDNKSSVYILGEEDKLQNSLLTYISVNYQFIVMQMYPRYNELQLFPRKCTIKKQDEGRFIIEFLE